MATPCTIVVLQSTDIAAIIACFLTGLGLPLENGKGNGSSHIGNSALDWQTMHHQRQPKVVQSFGK